MTTIDTSSIDATKPIQGAATTQSVRDNFAEIITQLDNAGTDIDGKQSTSATLSELASGNRAGFVYTTKAQVSALTLSSADAGRKIFITSADGGEFTVEDDVSAPYADDGGSYCGTQFIPSGGDGTIGIVRDYSGPVNAMWFGAKGDGVTDDTSAIQTAIDAVNTAGGGNIYLPVGTYIVSVGGTISTRDYGILLKSNVGIIGAGSQYSIIKAAASTDMDVMTTARTTATSNVRYQGFQIDGDSANQTDGGQNLWLFDVDNVYVDDLFSKDSGVFGFRFETVTNMQGGTLRVSHIAETNADGIHFYDSSYVAIDKMIIDTAGDDAFIISAVLDDSHDISVGELVTSSPVTIGAGGRGILLNLADVAAASRSIYNINIGNAVIYNCNGPAVLLYGAQFYNININAVDYGSKNSLDLNVGTASYAGYVRNSKFTIKSWNSDQSAITTSLTNGVIEYCQLDAQIYNPGDTYAGCTLYGDYWKTNIQMDYDPNGTKVSASHGVDVHGDYNNIKANVDGAATNLNLRSTATDNTISLTSKNSSTRDVAINSSTNTTFVGGSIANSILDNGTNTQFHGVIGATGYNSSNISPDANGNGTIAHGLVGTPTYIQVGIRGDNVNGVDVQTVDGTNITVRIKDAAGADVTTGTFTIDWEAKL